MSLPEPRSPECESTCYQREAVGADLSCSPACRLLADSLPDPLCAREGCERPLSEHDYGMFCP